jgi:hypothetical protein
MSRISPWLHWRGFCRTAFVALITLWASTATPLAGPPFVTDDPDPGKFEHWEFDIAATPVHTSGGWSGAAPSVEADYGLIPNLQLHIIMPLAFSGPAHGATQFGAGDTELGIKYRLTEEAGAFPAIAIFPLVEVPTGNQAHGLGTGQTDVFLPVWLQKTFGKWTVDGGGGYWINPGEGNQNWGFVGAYLQRQVAKNLALGTEVFHETAQTRGGSSRTIVNAGATWDLSDRYHLLFSAGHSVQGPSSIVAYGGIQITFGPEHESSGVTR